MRPPAEFVEGFQSFWNAPSLQAVARSLEEREADEPFSHLASRSIAAAGHHQRHGVNKLDELNPSYVRAAPSIRPPHVLSAFPYIDGPDDRY